MTDHDGAGNIISIFGLTGREKIARRPWLGLGQQTIFT